MIATLRAIVVLVFALAFLVPRVDHHDVHLDEIQYAWSSAYFGARVARLDFSVSGTHEFRDPAWAPMTYWNLTQPMGSRAIYWIAQRALGVEPPTLPYSFDDPSLQGPETRVHPRTLRVMRLAGAAAGAIGLALIALRWGSRGTFAALLFLATPHVGDDLTRGWAEGPLVLGLGLAASLYGTRWFAPACGLAATFKLTALGLWPIVFLRGGIGRGRFRRLQALSVAVAVWCVLTPASWFVGGPPYLLMMGLHRQAEHSIQSAASGGPLGLFLPARYFIPLELAAAAVAAWVVFRLLTRTFPSLRWPVRLEHAALPATPLGSSTPSL